MFQHDGTLRTTLLRFMRLQKIFQLKKNLILSKVLVLCNLLESVIFDFNPTKSQMKLLIFVMKREITNHFEVLERGSLYVESTILDPRFTKLSFKNNSTYDNAVKLLHNM